MNQLEDIKELFNEEIYKVSQKTLVIIPVPWIELTSEDTQLLDKILSAVKLSISSVQILHAPALSESIIMVDKPGRILLFGVPVNSTVEKYKATNFNGIPLIAADSLDSLDDPKKKELWVALRAMFAN